MTITVTNQSPPPGTVLGTGATVSFDVTADVSFFVQFNWPTLGFHEMVWSPSGLVAPYLASQVTLIPGGYSFLLRRSGNWPAAAPGIVVDGLDALQGGSNVLTVRASATADLPDYDEGTIILEDFADLDDIDLEEGDHVLLRLQSDELENGLYAFEAAPPLSDYSGTLTRTGVLVPGLEVRVLEGTLYGGNKYWLSSPTQAIETGVDDIEWSTDNPAAGDTANTPDTLVLRDGDGDIVEIQGKELTIATTGGGGGTLLHVTTEGIAINGDPEADQDGAVKEVAITAPSGNPTAGSVFRYLDVADGIWKMRDSAGNNIPIDDKARIQTITTNAQTLTYDGRVKVLESAAVTATLAAGVTGQVVVVKALIGCTITRTSPDQFKKDSTALSNTLVLVDGDSRTLMFDGSRWLVL